MERAIGEVFELDGVKLRVKYHTFGCNGCYFDGEYCEDVMRVGGTCVKYNRRDRQNVIFTEVKE